MTVPIPTRIENMNKVLTPQPLDPAPEFEIMSGTCYQSKTLRQGISRSTHGTVEDRATDGIRASHKSGRLGSQSRGGDLSRHGPSCSGKSTGVGEYPHANDCQCSALYGGGLFQKAHGSDEDVEDAASDSTTNDQGAST